MIQLCVLLTAEWTSLVLHNAWSVNWHCPRRKEVSSYLEKTHPSSILCDMKIKCYLGELSPALEGMWRNYSESKGCSLMSESYSIWLYLQRATLSNIVAKLCLLLNASETKLLLKPEKKNQSFIYWSIQWLIHTKKTLVYYMLKSLVVITVT